MHTPHPTRPDPAVVSAADTARSPAADDGTTQLVNLAILLAQAPQGYDVFAKNSAYLWRLRGRIPDLRKNRPITDMSGKKRTVSLLALSLPIMLAGACLTFLWRADYAAWLAAGDARPEALANGLRLLAAPLCAFLAFRLTVHALFGSLWYGSAPRFAVRANRRNSPLFLASFALSAAAGYCLYAWRWEYPLWFSAQNFSQPALWNAARLATAPLLLATGIAGMLRGLYNTEWLLFKPEALEIYRKTPFSCCRQQMFAKEKIIDVILDNPLRGRSGLRLNTGGWWPHGLGRNMDGMHALWLGTVISEWSGAPLRPNVAGLRKDIARFSVSRYHGVVYSKASTWSTR